MGDHNPSRTVVQRLKSILTSTLPHWFTTLLTNLCVCNPKGGRGLLKEAGTGTLAPSKFGRQHECARATQNVDDHRIGGVYLCERADSGPMRGVHLRDHVRHATFPGCGGRRINQRSLVCSCCLVFQYAGPSAFVFIMLCRCDQCRRSPGRVAFRLRHRMGDGLRAVHG